ncbi:cysteine proteinase [Lichtheimia corymbifera JMRC:FSU:9682]|uniref:Ubiquitin carboxyl-terminal hydrolase n=1 Tax=Lichtheimia corymbifera JMRC:FSU:9682 TaxID=1263082 RepID=A0A068RFX6_9FUNG|nr:cysteine proteinase [Lichtheimia corymbifera JMRC:FSU:9682]
MQLTLENLQTLLTDLTSFIHFFLAVVVLLIILLAAHAFPFHHDYSLLTTAFHVARSCCRYLSIYNLPLRSGIWLSSSVTSVAMDEDEICKQPPVESVCLCEDIAAAGSTLVSGLVNTGNSCYINSVLQVLSSLPRLQLYLDYQMNQQPQSRRPVTFSLAKTLRLLTRPLSKRSTFRPKELVAAMNNRRISSHDQQDAQELFQLITSALDLECHQNTKKSAVSLGLKDILHFDGEKPSRRRLFFSLFSSKNDDPRLENPFTGLLANRLSCMQCGYTEAIRHFSFNNVQLVLPDTYATTLDECLREFTAMEYLSDATCRKCALIDTVSDMTVQVEAMQEQARQATADKAERRRILTEMVNLDKQRRELEHRLNAGQIHEEDEKLRAVSRMSCKQAMFAKLPKVLCLHLSRSTFHPSGAILKNGCRISFPEILDLQAYCTNGTLNTQPDLPISKDDNGKNDIGNSKYRLMGVIVHYGSHDFGHFIAYKRRLVTDMCNCFKCKGSWSMRGDDSTWYRISDEQVDLCTVDEALHSNPYMLLYEQIESIEPPAACTAPSLLSALHHPSLNNSSSPTIITSTNLPSGRRRNSSTMDEHEPLISTTHLPSITPSAATAAASSSSHNLPFYGSCLTRRDERWSEAVADRRQSAPVIRV